MQKGSAALLFLLIGTLVAVVGIFIYMNTLPKPIPPPKFNPTPTPTSLIPNGPSPSPTPTDNYPGWKTYTNTHFNYKLRYPSDWTYKEIKMDTWEMSGKPVEFVEFYTPDHSYMLSFGARTKGEETGLSTRTGTGAGEFTTGPSIAVHGSTFTITHLVYQQKLKAVFYSKAGGIQNVGNYDIYADFDYAGSGLYDYDLTNSEDYSNATKIVTSFYTF